MGKSSKEKMNTIPFTVTMEPTNTIVLVEGVEVRVWEGKTSTGIPVHCLVSHIAVKSVEDQVEFLKHLSLHSPISFKKPSHSIEEGEVAEKS